LAERARRNPDDRVNVAASSGKDIAMNNIIYIVGLVVVVLAVLAFFGLR